MLCSACGSDGPFSNNQRRKGAYRRCVSCTYRKAPSSTLSETPDVLHTAIPTIDFSRLSIFNSRRMGYSSIKRSTQTEWSKIEPFSLLFRFPGDFILSILIEWILVEELAHLDSAICDHKTRRLFLDLLASPHSGIKSVAATKCFNLTSCLVPWLENRMVFMKEISFHSNNDVPSPFLPTTGRSLQSLNLTCNQVTDAGIGLIAASCSSLQSLNLTYTSNLTNCNQITDAGLELIAQGCSSLHTFYIGHCKQITDHGLGHIVQV